MVIQKIDSDIEKKGIARAILEVLPDWFGIPEATEAYIADSKGRPFFCAIADDVPVGFLYLKETGRHTVELAVMGVRQEYHRQGIGRALFEQAKAEAKRLGYSFIQVKTVQMGRYAIYDDTNRFYLSLGIQGTGSVPNAVGRMESLPDLYNDYIGSKSPWYLLDTRVICFV